MRPRRARMARSSLVGAARPAGRGAGAARAAAEVAGLCLGTAGLTSAGGWSAPADALKAGAAPFGRLAAQDFAAEAVADTTEMHVGDPVAVRLSVAHPPGWSVQWPDSFDLGAFEVLEFEAFPPVAGSRGAGEDADAGTMRSEARLVVTSFELGEQEIPSLSLVAAGPEGALDTVRTNPFGIGVVTVGLDEGGQARDIKGPLSAPRSWWGPALFGLAAAAVGAAVVLLARRRRRRPAGTAPAKPGPPPRPPRLVALEALAALEASPLLEQGRVKEYHVRASEIVRTYLEDKLEVPALELATGEVAAEMRRAALDARLCEQVREFLEACDLVKFAKLRPSADASRALLGDARRIVEATSGGVSKQGLGERGDGRQGGAGPESAAPDAGTLPQEERRAARRRDVRPAEPAGR